MQIRPFQATDELQLLAFLRGQYADSPLKADADYFRWRFVDNPLGSALPNYWLAWADGQIAGQLATLADRIRIGDSWYDASWLIDLVVAPAHRDTLATLRLFQAAMDSRRLLLTSGAIPASLKLYEALGWRRLRISETFYLPIRPGRLVAQATASASGRAASWAMFVWPALKIADHALPGAHRLAGHGRSAWVPGYTVTRLDTFDERIQAVVNRIAPTIGNTAWRSREQLRWKFAERPAGCHAAYLATSDDGEPSAYWVFKPMRRTGGAAWLEIVDYLIAPEAAALFTAMTSAAQAQALRLDVDAIRIRLSRPEHVSLLKRPWWLNKTAAVSDEVMLWSADSELLRCAHEQPWHLTGLAADRVDYGRDEWPEQNESIE